MHLRHPLLGLLLLPTLLAAQTPPAPPPPAGPVESPFLGIQTELKNPSNPSGGVVVSYLWPLSTAKEMGFQLGDEIRTLNDVLITDPETFSREVRKENVGARLRFRIVRAGKDLKLDGRIGSREKTFKAYQDQARKDHVGKPLPPFPALTWWNPTTRAWEDNANGLNALKGKIAIVMSFDNCKVCVESRYRKLSQMQALLAKAPGGDQLAYAGIFFDDRPATAGKENNLKTATELLTASPPTVPVAVAYYPAGKPTAQDRDSQVLIHNHGTAILNPAGNVEFLQVVGVPEQEFTVTLQKLLLAQGEKGKAGASPAAPGKPSSP